MTSPPQPVIPTLAYAAPAAKPGWVRGGAISLAAVSVLCALPLLAFGLLRVFATQFPFALLVILMFIMPAAMLAVGGVAPLWGSVRAWRTAVRALAWGAATTSLMLAVVVVMWSCTPWRSRRVAAVLAS